MEKKMENEMETEIMGPQLTAHSKCERYSLAYCTDARGPSERNRKPQAPPLLVNEGHR